MRPYLLFVSGVCGLTGMALSNGKIFSLHTFVLAFVPYFLGYGFGQALTDCFQIDTDSISSPYRPLTQKVVSPFSVAIVSIIGLVTIFSLLIYLNIYNALLGILSIIGLLTYTYFKKNYWLLGPFYNGWIVALIPIGGFLSISRTGLSSIYNEPLVMVVMLSLFSYAYFVLIGYLKDITADRATGYRTFPVVFGWNKTVYIGDLFAGASFIISLCFIPKGNIFSMFYFITASVFAFSGQMYAHFTKNKTEANSSFPIACTVRSLILWHLSVVTTYQIHWAVFTIIFYAFFEIVLLIRPKREQI
jgi:4-hydroxybenzoate polyprenyltransferase